MVKTFEVFGVTYQIDENGNIPKRKGVGFKVATKNPNGYLHQTFCVAGGKRADLSVHRLVAEAFVPNPEGLPEVNHKDKNKEHNHYSNLEWVTRQRNVEHDKAEVYLFISPTGEEVQLYNLKKFCEKSGLITSCMYRVASGLRRSHKGWRKA